MNSKIVNPSDQEKSDSSLSCQKLGEIFKNFKPEDIDNMLLMLTRLKNEMAPQEQKTNKQLLNNDSEQKSTPQPPQPREKEVLPSRKTRWVKNITIEQSKQKRYQQEFIAESFILYGINYHYITQKFPKMSPKIYRCYVEAINNQTVNDIIDFLRYECTLEIERLNRDQKRSIRTQLTKIKQWLGNIDNAQLECFYNFIRRHYDKNSVVIIMEDALKLYKTILSIIKCPSVNVFDEAAAAENDEIVCGMKRETANTLLILYIKWKDITKVTDLMCQKYGYQLYLSCHSIKISLKNLLEASLDKLISHLQSKEKDLYMSCFTPKNRAILQEVEEIDLKINLYSYFMEKKPKYVKAKNLVLSLRGLFDRYSTQSTFEVSLPKIEQALTCAVKKWRLTTRAAARMMLKKKLDQSDLSQNIYPFQKLSPSLQFAEYLQATCRAVRDISIQKYILFLESIQFPAEGLKLFVALPPFFLLLFILVLFPLLAFFFLVPEEFALKLHLRLYLLLSQLFSHYFCMWINTLRNLSSRLLSPSSSFFT